MKLISKGGLGMVQEEAMQSNRYRSVTVALYLIFTMLSWAAWFAQAPLLAAYWEPVFHIGAATGNLLLSVPGIVGIVFALFIGRWMDSLGTKKMMVIATIFALAGFGLRPFFPASFVIQVVLALVGGASICIGVVALAPLMIEWFGPTSAHSYIGFGAGALYLGAGIGIIITALLMEPLGIAGTFSVYSILLLLVSVLWWIFAHQKPKAETTTQQPSFQKEFKNAMQTGSAWLNLLTLLLVAGSSVFVMAFLPAQMIEMYKMPAPLAGTGTGIFALGMGAGAIFLPPLAGRFGRKNSALIYVIIELILWIVYFRIHMGSDTAVLVMAFALGFFYSVAVPLCMAIQEALPGVTHANMGIVGGLLTLALNIGTFALPLILAVFLQRSGLTGGFWAIIITYFLALLTLVFTREKRV